MSPATLRVFHHTTLYSLYSTPEADGSAHPPFLDTPLMVTLYFMFSYVSIDFDCT